jgi:carboxymethylenebutenolidase
MDNLATNITTDGERNATFKVDGREDGMGYLSPENKTSTRGIVLIQEWWGMNKNITNLADKWAKEGFIVISPDIYRGKVAKSREQAGHLMTGLDFEGAVKDILGAGLYLRSLGCTSVSVTGFCMGGALSFATLSRDSNGVFNSGAPFYGIPDQSYFPVENIKVPVLAHFGELDQLKGFSDVESARNLETKAKNGNVDFSLHVWEGANHAFMNVDSPNYNQEVSIKAQEETLNFFKKF